MVKNLFAMQVDPGLISGLRRSPGEGNGSPLQDSCLENPMDRGAWQAIVHGVARVGHDLVTKPTPSESYTQLCQNALASGFPERKSWICRIFEERGFVIERMYLNLCSMGQRHLQSQSRLQVNEEIGSTFGWEEQQHIEEECGYLTPGALVFFCCCIFY